MSYYTDMHIVDEDLRTISVHDGDWTCKSLAGITARNVCDTPTTTLEIVASNSRNIVLFKKNKHHSPSLEGE